MRKIIVLISILSLIVLLVGCNDIEPSTNDSTPKVPETNEPTIEQTSDSNLEKTDTHSNENNDTTEETSVGAVDDGNKLLSPYSGYVDGVVRLEGTFSENYYYYMSALLEGKWEYNRPAVMYHLTREMNLTREDLEIYYTALGAKNVPESIYAGLLADTLEESMQLLKSEYAFYDNGKLYTLYDIYELDNENALTFNIDDAMYDSVWQSIAAYLKTPTAVDVGDAMRAYVNQKADVAKDEVKNEDSKEPQIELDDVIKAYQTASEAAAWFRIASLLEDGNQGPVDMSTEVVYNDLSYFRVMQYNSYSEFIDYLGAFFSDELIKAFLSHNGTMYINHNGYLYGRFGMRGTNIFIGAESYEIEYVNNEKVNLLVEVEVMGEDLSTVKEYQTFIFPYENIDGKWVFTDFPEIR